MPVTRTDLRRFPRTRNDRGEREFQDLHRITRLSESGRFQFLETLDSLLTQISSLSTGDGRFLPEAVWIAPEFGASFDEMISTTTPFQLDGDTAIENKTIVGKHFSDGVVDEFQSVTMGSTLSDEDWENLT